MAEGERGETGPAPQDIPAGELIYWGDMVYLAQRAGKDEVMVYRGAFGDRVPTLYIATGNAERGQAVPLTRQSRPGGRGT